MISPRTANTWRRWRAAPKIPGPLWARHLGDYSTAVTRPRRDEIMKARRAQARASLNAMCLRVSIARVRVDDGAAQCHVRNPAPAGAGRFAVRAIS
ncbi:hypothetical protein MPLB_1680129 [Mesorhizobium sp. ORS 3324]|nr:hypothetical protein MPLB_1680129 [Mesorhizobium sp. ORS 3324]